MVMESRKLLTERKKYYENTLLCNKQKSKDFDKLPPIQKNQCPPPTTISTQNNYIKSLNMPPISLPSWCYGFNRRIGTHSPDEYSKKVIDQCSKKQKPPEIIIKVENTTSNDCDMMRMSKDSWFEEEVKTTLTNNETTHCWRQLPRPERWRWRQQHPDDNNNNRASSSIVTSPTNIKKHIISSSSTSSQRLVTITTRTADKRIDIHNNSKNVCDGSSSCYSGSSATNCSWGVKRRNGFKTTRSAVSSYLKVRRRDSNTSALTIFSICEQLCRLNNRFNNKGNKKHSNLVSSSSRKYKRNILPVSHIDEYLFTIVQKAWNTPSTSTVSTLQKAITNRKFNKRLKMNKDERTQQSTLTTEMNDNNKTTSSSPTWSPILTRRRLSVPEIIMRKYALTRDRSRSNSNNSEESLSSLLPEKNTNTSYHGNTNNNRSPNRHSWNINERTSGSDGDLSTLLRDTNSRSPRHRRIDNTSQIHRSALLRRFWNKELERNHSVDVIYTPTISKKLSPTRFSSRLRENVLVNNSIRREKFCSTSDLNDNLLRAHSVNANSTPNITNLIDSNPRSICSTGFSMDYPYSCLTTGKTENFESDDEKSILLPEKIENISKSIVKNVSSPVNVVTGSVYKPIDTQNDTLIPRYSAIPRTISMEVSVSSGECQTEDSDDMISLVDSLEDTTSPRLHGDSSFLCSSSCIQSPKSLTKLVDYDNKPVRGDIRLRGDSFSEDDTKSSPRKKGDAFFLRIYNDHVAKVDENPVIVNSLPKRIEAKIHKRQAVIAKHKKLRTTKSSFHLISSKVDKKPTSNVTKPLNKVKKRDKLLKELQLMESFKIDSHGNMKMLTSTNNKENNWIKRSELQNQRRHDDMIIERHRKDMTNELESSVIITSNLQTTVPEMVPNHHPFKVTAKSNLTFVASQNCAEENEGKREYRCTTNNENKSNRNHPDEITTTKSNLTFITDNENTLTKIVSKSNREEIITTKPHATFVTPNYRSAMDHDNSCHNPLKVVSNRNPTEEISRTKSNFRSTTDNDNIHPKVVSQSNQTREEIITTKPNITYITPNYRSATDHEICQEYSTHNPCKGVTNRNLTEEMSKLNIRSATDNDNIHPKVVTKSNQTVTTTTHCNTIDQSKVTKSNVTVTTRSTTNNHNTADNNYLQYTTIQNNNCTTTTNPRRIYQKTEFNNGDKKIEILEIVECVDNDNSDDVRRCNNRFKSKIPIPVLPVAPKMIESTRKEGGGYCLDCKEKVVDEAATTTIRLDQKPINIMRAVVAPSICNENNPSVDRLIAGILIGNMNNNPKSHHRHTKFESIPEEDHKNNELANNNVTDNKHKDLNKNAQKLYRTHVTLIMKSQTDDEPQKVDECTCQKLVKDVGTNTLVPPISIVKEIATNTETKKQVVPKKPITKHSCVLGTKPTTTDIVKSKKVVNKNIQTIDMCDNSTQTTHATTALTAQHETNQIVSKETQTTECTNPQHVVYKGREAIQSPPTVQSTVNYHHQHHQGTDDQIPNGWKSFYHLELDHQQSVCDDDNNDLANDGPPGGGGSSFSTEQSSSVPPAGLKNDDDFIEKLNKYRRTLRKQHPMTEVSSVPLVDDNDHRRGTEILHHKCTRIINDDNRKLKVFDDENDNHSNDSELFCGVDSENATITTAATTANRYHHHQRSSSSILSLKKQNKRIQHHQKIDQKYGGDKKKGGAVCGWSITVSGTNNNNNKITPDLKMRLKFPTNKHHNQTSTSDKRHSDSGIGDESCSNQYYYPSMSLNQQQSNNNNIIDYDEENNDVGGGTVVKSHKSQRSKMNYHHSFDNSIPPHSSSTHHHLQNKFKFPCLPNVNKLQRTTAPPQSSTKPTKTPSIDTIITNERILTTRNKRGINSIRYRPSGLRQMKSNSGKWSYTEEIKFIDPPPGSLAIMGSTISPEQKPKVTTMSERDLTWRLLHTPNSLYHRY